MVLAMILETYKCSKMRLPVRKQGGQWLYVSNHNIYKTR